MRIPSSETSFSICSFNVCSICYVAMAASPVAMAMTTVTVVMVVVAK